VDFVGAEKFSKIYNTLLTAATTTTAASAAASAAAPAAAGCSRCGEGVIVF